MSFSIEFADEHTGYDARIKVIGCGGSGGNAVNTMINFGLEGVEFVVVNTDAQALAASAAPFKLPIGASVTRGLGAGADPDKGRKAALEDVTRIKETISGSDMVFVTAGMGGGTGTGAAPVIAQLAREEGCLTVGVVTKPFFFEGKQRSRRAEIGLSMLAEHVDTLITIPNQKLLALGDEELSFVEAFRKADEVLYQAIKGISDLITQNGLVNVDFADVKTVMSNMGRALMGTGCAKGQGRARLAAETAINSPLLDNISVDGATGVLINIVGGPDMRMREIDEAASFVQEQAHEDANIIFGAAVDENMGEMMKVTVIATGFDQAAQEAAAQLVSQVPRTATGLTTLGASQPPVQAPISAQPLSQQVLQAQSVPAPMPTTLQAQIAQAQQLQPQTPHAAPAPLSAAVPQHSQNLGPQPGMCAPLSSPMNAQQQPATARAGSPLMREAEEAARERLAHEEGEREAPTASRRRATSTRDRASFVPPLDSDWDTPAYQRRGN